MGLGRLFLLDPSPTELECFWLAVDAYVEKRDSGKMNVPTVKYLDRIAGGAHWARLASFAIQIGE